MKSYIPVSLETEPPQHTHIHTEHAYKRALRLKSSSLEQILFIFARKLSIIKDSDSVALKLHLMTYVPICELCLKPHLLLFLIVKKAHHMLLVWGYFSYKQLAQESI